ncbi:MAG TPA: oxygen-independent coproporphyrinogen III oxidase [Bdellovibrionales bacterium]|nr:oxygen-independent coproporphyrinogen III oxidase [Pseudobdellovibrionaceae bacterium]HAG91684.1 oxygen-independent coproporphyrinogen III oxidase [Bdellovibrionales bacterium]|tara:strand:- start:2074 stop:3429 length:1356 start_codon:yes stop_codon:yes gene_type:complete
MISKDLLEKYDTPVPRYTSYPTVPYWSDSPSTEEWLSALRLAASKKDMTWSIYMHVPFCESLCTFCGCNTVISRSHDKEMPYVQSLLKEFSLYKKNVPELFEKPLRQLHLGGGTPTFLSAENLKFVVGSILEQAKVDPDQFDGSIEVDPRRTSPEQLKALYDLGFRRVSMGVQDFNHEVQRLINRIQPFDVTKKLTEEAREMGYTSVNFDLIYGLPKQDLEMMRETVLKTIELRPERIALYSFALVPWIKPQQRLFKDEDLPVGAEKRELYELSYELLTEAGYREIGMDHFALPEDELSKSMDEGKLHRNFMGYAELRTDVLLGLGVSSISETPTCFHQNEKVVANYMKRVDEEGEIPTLRGHKLNEEDQNQREMILKFMTLGEVHLTDSKMKDDIQEFLNPMIQDGLVQLEGENLKILEPGRPFLRNACMALDFRLRRSKPESKVFSQSL